MSTYRQLRINLVRSKTREYLVAKTRWNRLVTLNFKHHIWWRMILQLKSQLVPVDISLPKSTICLLVRRGPTPWAIALASTCTAKTKSRSRCLSATLFRKSKKEKIARQTMTRTSSQLSSTFKVRGFLILMQWIKVMMAWAIVTSKAIATWRMTHKNLLKLLQATRRLMN